MVKQNYRVIMDSDMARGASDYISHKVTRTPEADAEHKLRGYIDSSILGLSLKNKAINKWKYDLNSVSISDLKAARSAIMDEMKEFWNGYRNWGPASGISLVPYDTFENIFLKRMAEKGYDVHDLINNPDAFYKKHEMANMGPKLGYDYRQSRNNPWDAIRYKRLSQRKES